MEEKKESDSKSTLVAVGTFVVVLVVVFLLLRFALTPKEAVVNGVLVQNERPREAISAALAPQAFAEYIVVSSENETIPGRAAAAAEIASGLAIAGKNVTVQASVRGEYCVNERLAAVECREARVILNASDCNCLRVENGVLYVLGSEQWLLENGNRFRAIVQWALERK